MEEPITPTATDVDPTRRPLRLWPWFGAGFLAVFVGMLLLVHLYAVSPTGQHLTRSPLWRYYADELPRLFGPATLGPAGGGSSAVLATAFFHLLLSVLGGSVIAAGRWFLRRRSGPHSA